MASIIIAPLTDVLDESSIQKLIEKLEKWDITLREQNEELDQGVENDLEDELLSDLLNDLEDEYEQADIYIPGVFPEIITIENKRIGSLDSLLEALESLQDGLGIDDPEGGIDDDIEYSDEDEDADFLDRLEISRLGLKSIWYDLYRVANLATELESNVIIRRD